MNEVYRCIQEQRKARDMMDSGHRDQRGLAQAATDWLMEEAIIRLEMKLLNGPHRDNTDQG